MLIKQGESRADFISRQVRSLLDDNKAESEDEAIAIAAQDYDSQRVKVAAFKVSDIDSEERTVTAVISSDAIDRDDEVLLPKGADIEQFQKNPVVLWSHNSHLPPIGKALWIERKGKKIIAKVKFAETELAEEVWQLFKGGFLKAFSVGFQPKSPGRVPTPAEIKKRPELASVRRIFDDWEMLEFSAVAVPANPEALATAIKSGQFTDIAKDFEQLCKEYNEDESVDDSLVTEPEPFEIKEKKFEVKKKTFKVKAHMAVKKHAELTLPEMVAHTVGEAVKKHKGIVY